jgi:hypothetical protein
MLSAFSSESCPPWPGLRTCRGNRFDARFKSYENPRCSRISVPLQLSWTRTRRSCGFDSAPAREGSHQWEGEENLANEVHIHLTIDWPTAIALEHLVVRTMLARITMRLSDTRLRRREKKVLYPNHRLPSPAHRRCNSRDRPIVNWLCAIPREARGAKFSQAARPSARCAHVTQR